MISDFISIHLSRPGFQNTYPNPSLLPLFHRFSSLTHSNSGTNSSKSKLRGLMIDHGCDAIADASSLTGLNAYLSLLLPLLGGQNSYPCIGLVGWNPAMGIVCHSRPIDKGIDVLISNKQHTEENLTMCKKLIQSRQPLHLQIQYVLEKNDQNLLIVQETPGVTLHEFFKRHNSQFFVGIGKKVLYVTPLFQRLLSALILTSSIIGKFAYLPFHERMHLKWKDGKNLLKERLPQVKMVGLGLAVVGSASATWMLVGTEKEKKN